MQDSQLGPNGVMSTIERFHCRGLAWSVEVTCRGHLEQTGIACCNCGQ